uniref:Ig-like domain-containing protein n=1 Tax=Zosterops lateralis melanops TaxID=1220523 RepID=A0A8D2P9B7_ZOSLA
MAGCVLYPNRTSQGFAYMGYNGQDFLSLNTKNVTWTLSQDTKFSRYVQSFFQNSTVFTELMEIMFNETCVDVMKMLLQFGRAALERQGETTLTLHVPHSWDFSTGFALDRPIGGPVLFYPRPISVAWLRDGQEVPPGPALNISPILPNADLTYQLRSVLAVAPRDGHSYVCRVHHQSLESPSPWCFAMCSAPLSSLPMPLVLVVSPFPASLLVVVSQCPLLSPL